MSTAFFTALAQISVGIIGFTIAIGAVIHELERQRRDRETEEFRKELISFKERYYRLIKNITYRFKISTMIKWSSDDEIGVQSDEEVLRRFNDDLSDRELEIARLGNNLQTIVNLLSEIGPESDYTLNQQEVDELSESVEHLYSYFFDGQSNLEELYSEVTSRSVSDDDEFEEILRERIFFDDHFPWYSKRVVEEFEAVDQEGEADNDDIDYDALDWGNSIYAFKRCSEKIYYGFSAIHQKKAKTYFDYSPALRPLVKFSAILALIGILVPLLFLTSVPEGLPTISIWLLFFTQIVMICFITLISASIFDLVTSNLIPSQYNDEKALLLTQYMLKGVGESEYIDSEQSRR